MKTIRMSPVTGSNKYCGPAVVSAFTGKSTDEVSRVIREYNGRRYIKGTTFRDLSNALAYWGINAVHKLPPKSVTLAAFLRERTDITQPMIIEVTGHWVAVQGRKFVDSKTREPVWIREAPGRRARVKAYIELTPIADHVPPAPVQPTRTYDPRVARARRLAKQLAQAHGFGLDKDRDLIWVEDWSRDEESDDAYCVAECWEEVLSFIQTRIAERRGAAA